MCNLQMMYNFREMATNAETKKLDYLAWEDICMNDVSIFVLRDFHVYRELFECCWLLKFNRPPSSSLSFSFQGFMNKGYVLASSQFSPVLCPHRWTGVTLVACSFKPLSSALPVAPHPSSQSPSWPGQNGYQSFTTYFVCSSHGVRSLNRSPDLWYIYIL